MRPPLRPMFCRNSWMYSKRRIGSGAGCARRTRAAASDPWAPDRKIRSRYGANRDALVLRGALPPPSSGVGARAGPPGIDLNLAVPDHHAGRTQDGFGQRSSGPTAAPPSRVMNSRRLICSHCRNHLRSRSRRRAGDGMATLRLVLRGGWWVGDRDRARAKAWHRGGFRVCVPIGGTLLEESLMII